MTENYINIQFNVKEYIQYYRKAPKRTHEIDFIIMREGKIIPIEVKSADNTRSKSLDYYMKKYQSEYSIKISTKNFGFENGVKSIPLYATFCI